jgi:diguanylate cyclase (GGDEF)-like protein
MVDASDMRAQHALRPPMTPPDAQRTQPRILLVDDDPAIIQALRKALVGVGELYFATSGRQALQMVSELRPDAVLLDAGMPDMGGLQVCEALRADPELLDVPVLFVTRHNETEMEQAALEAGAVDFITKPIRPSIVAMRVKTHLRLRAANERLRRLASTDSLTGLHNRRTFDDTLEREWRRCLRAGSPLSLLMIDVDAFKLYHYGHTRGDECLTAVAGAIRSCVHRPFDLVARYGGEEFVVLLPETDAVGALHVGRHLLANIESRALPHAHSPVRGHVTVSVGVSSYDNTCDVWVGTETPQLTTCAEAADVIWAADLGLYAAKRAGRAQQCLRSIDRAVEQRLVQTARVPTKRFARR